MPVAPQYTRPKERKASGIVDNPEDMLLMRAWSATTKHARDYSDQIAEALERAHAAGYPFKRAMVLVWGGHPDTDINASASEELKRQLDLRLKPRGQKQLAEVVLIKEGQMKSPLGQLLNYGAALAMELHCQGITSLSPNRIDLLEPSVVEGMIEGIAKGALAVGCITPRNRDVGDQGFLVNDFARFHLRTLAQAGLFNLGDTAAKGLNIRDLPSDMSRPLYNLIGQFGPCVWQVNVGEESYRNADDPFTAQVRETRLRRYLAALPEGGASVVADGRMH